MKNPNKLQDRLYLENSRTYHSEAERWFGKNY